MEISVVGFYIDKAIMKVEAREACIGGSYDERAVAAVAVVRRSQGQAGNLVRGLEAPFSGPEDRLPASDCLTGSDPPKGRRRRRTTAATAFQSARARA